MIIGPCGSVLRQNDCQVRNYMWLSGCSRYPCYSLQSWAPGCGARAYKLTRISTPRTSLGTNVHIISWNTSRHIMEGCCYHATAVICASKRLSPSPMLKILKCRCGEDGNWNSYSLQLNLYAIVMLLLKGQSIQQLLQHLQGQHYSCYCYTCLRRSGQFILPSPPPPEKPSGRSVEQVQ